MNAELGLRERKKQQTRAAIREAALELFLAQGYSETTTIQIAAAANVSPGTLFNYFPTKDSLLTDDFDPIFIRHMHARPPDERADRHPGGAGKPRRVGSDDGRGRGIRAVSAGGDRLRRRPAPRR